MASEYGLKQFVKDWERAAQYVVIAALGSLASAFVLKNGSDNRQALLIAGGISLVVLLLGWWWARYSNHSSAFRVQKNWEMVVPLAAFVFGFTLTALMRGAMVSPIATIATPSALVLGIYLVPVIMTAVPLSKAYNYGSARHTSLVSGLFSLVMLFAITFGGVFVGITYLPETGEKTLLIAGSMSAIVAMAIRWSKLQGAFFLLLAGIASAVSGSAFGAFVESMSNARTAWISGAVMLSLLLLVNMERKVIKAFY